MNPSGNQMEEVNNGCKVGAENKRFHDRDVSGVAAGLFFVKHCILEVIYV